MEHGEVRAPGEWIKCRTTCRVTWFLFPTLIKICWVILGSGFLTSSGFHLAMCKAGVLSTGWSLWEAEHIGMQRALRFSTEMLGRRVKHLYACWDIMFMVCECLKRMSSFSRWSKSATLSPIRVKTPWLRPNTWSPLSHWHHGRLIFFNKGKAYSYFKWWRKESEKAQHSGRSFRELFSCLPRCTNGESGGCSSSLWEGICELWAFSSL